MQNNQVSPQDTLQSELSPFVVPATRKDIRNLAVAVEKYQKMSDQESLYIDKPKHRNPGVSFLCICQNDREQPTHESDAMGNMICWCKRCRLYLGLREMDNYYHSELFTKEKSLRKKHDEGDL